MYINYLLFLDSMIYARKKKIYKYWVISIPFVGLSDASWTCKLFAASFSRWKWCWSIGRDHQGTSNLLLKLLFFLSVSPIWFLFLALHMWIRYWEHQPERKSSAWTQTIPNLNFLRLKHTRGIRSLAFSSKI